MSNNNLCMGCMKEIGNVGICPYCGFPSSSVQKSPYLPYGTVVGDRYLIGKLLDHNGEGALYLGYDLEKNITVDIRELLPEFVVAREAGACEITVLPGCEIVFSDCSQSFLELWRKLARMRGLSALICVIDIVEDYGTAYAVYESVEELKTLREYLLDTPAGYITWEQARLMFMPVLSTLGTLHTAGIIHRGISPTTLLVTGDGKMIISGFSIGQARSINGELTPQLFSGYAPVEQYGFEGRQGPWTDVYAFAATLYRALVGSTPVEATSRLANDKLMIPAKFAEQLPAYVINGLVNALQIQPDDRTKNVEQMRNDFSASPAAVVAAGTYSTYSTPEKPRETAEQKEIVNPKKPEAKVAEQKKKNKRSAMTTFVVTACVCFFALATVLLCVFIDRQMSGDETTETQVGTPDVSMHTVANFVGKYSTDVTDDPYYAKFYTFEVEFVYDANTEQGKVVWQSAEAGTEFSSDNKLNIVLRVSKGTEYVSIVLNEYIGKKYDAVKDRFVALGVECEINDSYVPQNEAYAGTIVTITSSGYTPTETELKVPRGAKITVYVYSSVTTAPQLDAFGNVITQQPTIGASSPVTLPTIPPMA